MKFLLLISLVSVTVLGEEKLSPEYFAEGNLNFASDVYNVLSKLNSGNFLVCPLSLQIVLALLHAGAGGNTAKELASGIRLPNDQRKIRRMIEELAPHLHVMDKYTLTSANKLYLSTNYKLLDQFKSTAVKTFAAESENIVFAQNKNAALAMNKWVEEQTYRKIKNIIRWEDLDENTVAVLLNTMYFKATWLNQFDHNYTHKRIFFVNSTLKVKVSLMTARARFNYYKSDDLNAKFIELPYEGNNTAMTLVLPENKEGLANLENRIAEVFVAPKYQSVEVEVYLPKFKMESEIPCIHVMEALGIKDAFTNKANFSGVTEASIFISTMVQKTLIELREKGTTAAASTATRFNSRLGPAHMFFADHPFIFFLKHKIAGVFFIGRFVNPDKTTLNTV